MNKDNFVKKHHMYKFICEFICVMFYSGSGLLFCIIKCAMFFKSLGYFSAVLIYCPDEIKIIN